MNIEYLQSRVRLDNIWIRPVVVKTVQQTIGVHSTTQQPRAHRVLQEKGWSQDQEHKQVTVVGVSLFS